MKIKSIGQNTKGVRKRTTYWIICALFFPLPSSFSHEMQVADLINDTIEWFFNFVRSIAIATILKYLLHNYAFIVRLLRLTPSPSLLLLLMWVCLCVTTSCNSMRCALCIHFHFCFHMFVQCHIQFDSVYMCLCFVFILQFFSVYSYFSVCLFFDASRYAGVELLAIGAISRV